MLVKTFEYFLKVTFKNYRSKQYGNVRNIILQTSTFVENKKARY